MSSNINTIAFADLLYLIIPTIVVIIIYIKWSLNYKNLIYALLRMFIQLIGIGYLLTYIFNVDVVWYVLVILFLMLIVASWIALRTIESKKEIYLKVFVSIFISGIFILFIDSVLVLKVSPWYAPRFIIPLAGMVFANAMNSVSLAVDRFYSELKNKHEYKQARAIALNTSLIPITNSLFAVGLVSLPGMMTGQILSGVSPLIAVRYQIMIMASILCSCGISSAIVLVLLKPKD